MSCVVEDTRRGAEAASAVAALPAATGIGLRSPHYRDLLERHPPLPFVEVHSENYFGSGGPPLDYLEQTRALYPLSLHGVGLSIGSVDPLSETHLAVLARLVDRFEPVLVSEHLCWGSVDGIHYNDLLPLPYTEEALQHVVARIGQVQERLGRRLLVENVSSYLRYAHSTIGEWEFLAEVARRADCDILLDVNNIHVSAVNHGFDATRYVEGIPAERVAEIHLAGHVRNDYPDGSILVDTHDRRVCDAVWELYTHTVRRLGPRPTLIEWDTDLPDLEVLVDEARHADRIMVQDRARPG